MELYKDIELKYPLRDYQNRVLEQMQYMLEDGRLHVSAAPGAGKTVLGLEAIRRLACRALILVPTINLRNQWKERFLSLFVDEKKEGLYDYWNLNFSTDLSNPGIITCSTYQALYQLYGKSSEETSEDEDVLTEDQTDTAKDKKGSSEEESERFKQIIEQYKSLGIQVICLDEAHHLKREWWKALTEFVGGMDASLIALTATPPMDTSNIEWKRYIQLCGDIDLEISIPEMVVKKCLCPHQDYLYICKPTAEEESKVMREIYRNKECEIAVLRSKELYNAVKKLNFLISPEENKDIILKNPDYISRLISYAAYISLTCQVELEESRELAETAFTVWDKRIVSMVRTEAERLSETGHSGQYDTAWFLPLMKDILENNPGSYPDSLKVWLKEILTGNHLMKDGRVKLSFGTENADRILKGSASKLNAIVDILESESHVCGDRLRALVLMDHIRKEDISKVETIESLTDLGVSSVFERLRRQEHLGNLEKYLEADTESNPASKRVYRTRLGVLTGSLVILPDSAAESLISNDSMKCKVKPLGVTGYSRVEVGSAGSDMIVSEVTELFEKGKIEILIGTAALLGEGWDAPTVNTLIIGSNSGTYVKTNQMRGRALRIPGGDESKVSNIWHLMTCSDNLNASGEQNSIRQRFDSIVGLSMDGRRIENGIERLNPGGLNMYDSENWNRFMLEKSRDRTFVKDRWEAVPAVFGSTEVRNVVNVAEKRFKGVSAGKSRLKRKEILSVADGLFRLMKDKHLIAASAELKTVNDTGNLEFYLRHATERDSRLYAEYLKQAMDDIIYPKFMLRFGFFGKRYCPVPDGFNKIDTAREYMRYVRGAKELIQTSTDSGKTILLKQRLMNTSAGGVKVIKELL